MKISIILSLLCLSISAFTQNNQGEITFEDKRNIHKSLPPEMEAMKDRIPEFRTSKKVLYFNGESAVYKGIKEEVQENQEFQGEGRGRGRFGRGGDDNIYYTSLTDNKSVDSQEFFGKKFLIEGNRESKKWKMTGEQKQVGDYLCQKAVFKDSTSNIVVWFTPMIPVSTGPDDYFGLPGLILHVDINEGERTITAQNIDLRILDTSLIEIPTEGKQIEKGEFEKIREDKMKEMEKERGGRGSFRGFGRH